MPRMTSADDIEQRARQLLDARITSVRALVHSRQQITDLRDQLTAAERADVQAYDKALTDGWTPDELKRLGLPEPTKRTQVRRRAVRKSAEDRQLP
jgi:hypothetical protein